ncbi:MAG: outer membrane lipoprotein-sorting protein [Oligoflexia bacterium]|nr:outer membrane lipoprotein-sorting protein [Oligoflexia bacterium]MBF0365880.1 outer membrane lipoprotein-sorting protein [Oligoflexia bacterium]
MSDNRILITLFQKNFVVCAALLKLGTAAPAGDWLKFSEEQIRGESSSAKLSMEIETPDWKRTLEINADSAGDSKSLIFITSPAKEKGVGTLRLENKMWNYFPKLKKTVVVSPSMLLTGWMGSDFTNDDLLKASSLAKDYSHKYLADEKVEGENYLVVEGMAKGDAKVIWPKIVVLLSYKSCLPVYQRYYDKKGTLIRTLKLSAVKEIDKHTIPTVWEMQPADKKSQKTILKYQEVDYDTSFSSSHFNLKTLERD